VIIEQLPGAPSIQQPMPSDSSPTRAQSELAMRGAPDVSKCRRLCSWLELDAAAASRRVRAVGMRKMGRLLPPGTRVAEPTAQIYSAKRRTRFYASRRTVCIEAGPADAGRKKGARAGAWRSTLSSGEGNPGEAVESSLFLASAAG
jgi:hypothetical protein